MIPAIFCFSLCGFMVGSMESRLLHPSRWAHCNKGVYFAWILIFGVPYPLNQDKLKIEENENSVEALEYEKEWEDRLKLDADTAKEELEMKEKMRKDLGLVDIATANTSNKLELTIMKRLGSAQYIIGGKDIGFLYIT